MTDMAAVRGLTSAGAVELRVNGISYIRQDALIAALDAAPPLTERVCTDPDCTIPRKPGFPMHGPHDLRAKS